MKKNFPVWNSGNAIPSESIESIEEEEKFNVGEVNEHGEKETGNMKKPERSRQVAFHTKCWSDWATSGSIGLETKSFFCTVRKSLQAKRETTSQQIRKKREEEFTGELSSGSGSKQCVADGSGGFEEVRTSRASMKQEGSSEDTTRSMSRFDF